MPEWDPTNEEPGDRCYWPACSESASCQYAQEEGCPHRGEAEMKPIGLSQPTVPVHVVGAGLDEHLPFPGVPNRMDKLEIVGADGVERVLSVMSVRWLIHTEGTINPASTVSVRILVREWAADRVPAMTVAQEASFDRGLSTSRRGGRFGACRPCCMSLAERSPRSIRRRLSGGRFKASPQC